jgi:hypothetical protein
MSKQEDYRRYAAQAVKLAQGASSADAKAHLLAVAEAWVDLADLARRIEQAAGAGPGPRERPDEEAANARHSAVEILPPGTRPADLRVAALIGRARLS